MTNEQIKQIALACGFNLKEQPTGEMDLNPYVYDFARELIKQNQQSAWISMKDALPDNGTDCLVWKEPKNDGYGSCGYIFSTFEDGKFEDIYTYEEVTHWQPLPEPPKGE